MSGMNCKLERLVVHPAYVLSIILAIQPINGVIVARGPVWLGIALIAMQVPWAIRVAFAMHNAEAHGRAVARTVQHLVGHSDGGEA